MAIGDQVGTTCSRASLSTFEIVISCNPPILESLLLHAPTATIFQLYHTSSYLRRFLRSYPTAWKYLSFRLLQPSPTPPPAAASIPGANGSGSRQSRSYALDQLLLTVVNPFSSCLKSLELDNTAVSGQTLISTVLSLRRESLQHLSIRGCKNVSLKYHIVPWLTLFSLQMGGQDPTVAKNPGYQELALKSLYTYRCRHHRRRPYLPSSLSRKDSDSEPTHELVNLCHQLGIWTDTAWCTTPGVRCFRRRGYVAMRVPVDTKEVWVVYDRLWRSKNWVGSLDHRIDSPLDAKDAVKRDGRLWEQDEYGLDGEALGAGNESLRYGDGKHLPMHLRKTHREFVEGIVCDNCSTTILERCEQCSVLMHCAGCRKTMCASCAFDRPYTRNRLQEAKVDDGAEGQQKDKYWWAPGCSISPCSMQDQDDVVIDGHGQFLPRATPTSKLKWCCTEPVFSGGGGITFGPANHSRDFERMRAAPLPRRDGWEDPEFGAWSGVKAQPYLAQDRIPSPRTRLDKAGHYDVMHQLLGAGKEPSAVPRNLCDECHRSSHWKATCLDCLQSLCLQHDLRGLKMRICGYRDLATEKEALNRCQKSIENMALSLEKLKGFLPTGGLSTMPELWRGCSEEGLPRPSESTLENDDYDGANTEVGQGSLPPALPSMDSPPATESEIASSSINTTAANNNESDRPNRPGSPESNATAAASRCTSPSPSVDSVALPSLKPANAPKAHGDGIEPHPKWSGCLVFACPRLRLSGDHRGRCSASFKECAGCKVNVCKRCADQMPKPCACDGCMDRSAANGDSLTPTAAPAAPPPLNGGLLTPHGANMNPGGGGAEANKFWCPNCRWERMLVGRCKVRQQERKATKGKGKEKGKDNGRRKGKDANGAATRAMPITSGIDDETAQNVAEFENSILRGDEVLNTESNEVVDHGQDMQAADPLSLVDLPPLPLSPPAVPSGEIEAATSDDSVPGAEERDLNRISSLVDDLQTRIERLRVVYASRRNSNGTLAEPEAAILSNPEVTANGSAAPATTTTTAAATATATATNAITDSITTEAP